MRPFLATATLGLAAALGLAVPQPGRAEADIATLEALREGDMRKLTFHAAPKAVSTSSFVDIDDRELSLGDLKGQVVVLNFWATWCAPCREEMPSLDRLNAALSGEAFQVVTLATGRNAPQAMRRFFEEEGIETLPLYRDPRQAVAREMAVLGLPITVILDREGREIARLTGDAEWDSESARAILLQLIHDGA